MLFIHDPKAMHHVAVKEQDIFEEATWFTRCVSDILARCTPSHMDARHREHSLAKRAFGPGLTATHGTIPSAAFATSTETNGSGACATGEYHRKQRKLLNPVFSINHMRHMMPTFYKVTHKVDLLPLSLCGM